MLVPKVGWGRRAGVSVGPMDMFAAWELRNSRSSSLKDAFLAGRTIFAVKLMVRVVVVVVVVGEGE